MMTPSSQFRARSAMFCALIGIAVLSFALPVHARVTAINITCTQSPTFGGASFGAVGQYELIQGTISGEVDPDNPQNAVIVDLDKAPRNPNGTVSYTADFQIFRPINLSQGNHRVIFDLPNRGGATSLSEYNNGTANTKAWCTTGLPSGFTLGDSFLMNQGFTIVEGAWDITIPTTAGPSFGVNFPVVTHRDGSAITGPATEELVVDFNATPSTLPLTYTPATLNPADASLTVRENYGDPPLPVPACGSGVTVVCWAYTTSAPTASMSAPGLSALNPAGTAVGLQSGGSPINFGATGTYSPTALYEFTYVATNPVPAGLGFASLRDLATFLRKAQTDDNNVANPLAGDVRAIYTTCVSQPCRTTRDFLLFGFNEPEHSGHDGDHHWGDHHFKVFDGIINWIGGGDGIYMNYRFAQPTRTSRQHIARWDPEFQFPWADIRVHDHVTHQTAGRLDACLKTDTCPKMFEMNSENEFYAKGGSMLTTDTRGNDLHLEDSPNVRYYLMSSLPHGPGTAAGICAQPQNPLTPSAVLRALTLDMDEWVTKGVEPPHNRVPKRSNGTLVPSLPQSGMGFPNIPAAATGSAVEYNGIMHTGDLFDFGPRFHEGIISIQPPILLGTPYPVFVPKTDADGNDIAGIRLPDITVPLATYTGYARRAAHAGQPVPIVDGCDASGQRIPFLETQAERITAGDPRLSIQERYPDHATYVNLVTQAAEKLESERLLLDMDVQAYITAAMAASVP